MGMWFQNFGLTCLRLLFIPARTSDGHIMAIHHKPHGGGTGKIGKYIVEVADRDWKRDGQPDDYLDCVGVRTQLQNLQTQHDRNAFGFPMIRVLRVRSPMETAEVVRDLMKKALQRTISADDVLPE